MHSLNLSAISSVCPSFSDTLRQVMAQVEFHCFADLRNGYIHPMYKELCLIISEVFLLEDNFYIKINGSDLPIRLVQDVYRQLRNDHIRFVFSNFHDVSSRVHNKKAYLRTSLYNAFFEIESHLVNAINDD